MSGLEARASAVWRAQPHPRMQMLSALHCPPFRKRAARGRPAWTQPALPPLGCFASPQLLSSTAVASRSYCSVFARDLPALWPRGWSPPAGDAPALRCASSAGPSPSARHRPTSAAAQDGVRTGCIRERRHAAADRWSATCAHPRSCLRPSTCSQAYWPRLSPQQSTGAIAARWTVELELNTWCEIATDSCLALRRLAVSRKMLAPAVGAS